MPFSFRTKQRDQNSLMLKTEICLELFSFSGGSLGVVAVEGYEPDPVAPESGAEGGEGRGEADGGRSAERRIVPLSVASSVRKF